MDRPARASKEAVMRQDLDGVGVAANTWIIKIKGPKSMIGKINTCIFEDSISSVKKVAQTDNSRRDQLIGLLLRIPVAFEVAEYMRSL